MILVTVKSRLTENVSLSKYFIISNRNNGINCVKFISLRKDISPEVNYFHQKSNNSDRNWSQREISERPHLILKWYIKLSFILLVWQSNELLLWFRKVLKWLKIAIPNHYHITIIWASLWKPFQIMAHIKTGFPKEVNGMKRNLFTRSISYVLTQEI